jgi:hypothetical protein
MMVLQAIMDGLSVSARAAVMASRTASVSWPLSPGHASHSVHGKKPDAVGHVPRVLVAGFRTVLIAGVGAPLRKIDGAGVGPPPRG